MENNNLAQTLLIQKYYVKCEQLTQPAALTVQPETLSLSCRGSGFTFTDYVMAWIRQPAGKGLEWIGYGYSSQSSNIYASSVRGRIEISREDSNSMTHLRLSNLKPEDSAVYYCAVEHSG
uniref:Ig-like domain-containing protein n=1 Tax=Poecilia reticulata TaxID=8081 RepID=A0A3P9MU12_POERE